jgi:hypothetical protein
MAPARLLSFFAGLAGLLASLTSCATAAPPEAALQSFAGLPMAPLDADSYVEPATPAAARDRLRRLSRDAARRIEAFYGARVGPRPVVIFCGADPCRLHFAGPTRRSWSLAPGQAAAGARYVAGARPTIVVVRTDAHAENVLAHELSHLELQSRARPGRAPTWFDEGVATAVGLEQDCAKVAPTPMSRLASLVDDDAWFAFTSAPGALAPAYCGARREVEAWLRLNGARALLALLDELRAGRAFEDVYQVAAIVTPRTQ